MTRYGLPSAHAGGGVVVVIVVKIRSGPTMVGALKGGIISLFQRTGGMNFVDSGVGRRGGSSQALPRLVCNPSPTRLRTLAGCLGKFVGLHGLGEHGPQVFGWGGCFLCNEGFTLPIN